MARESSPTGKKILLLLLAGLAIGLTYDPRRHARIIKGLEREWKKIDQKVLRNTINQLYRSRLVQDYQNEDGSTTLVLSEKGKIRAFTYQFEEMRVHPPERWDGKWHMVAFDVPEKKKPLREALRKKLRLDLGFYELQKSVLVFPYECKNEIDFIVEFYHARPYVRYGVLESVDNDLHLRKIFDLI